MIQQQSMENIHRNLMVNFIPPTWTSENLQAFFQQYGVIEECKVVVDKLTGASKGFGFVKFSERESAENAMTQANGTQIEGKQLKIQKAELGKGPTGPANCYVSGFDPTIYGQDELQQAFAPYGNNVSVKVHASQSGKKGVAFVTFENYAEAKVAADTLNGSVLGDDTLTVRIAEATAKKAQGGPKVFPAATPYMNFGPGVRFPMMQGGGIAMPMASRYQPYKRPMQRPLVIPPPNGADGNYCIFVYGVRGMDEVFLWKLFEPFGIISNTKAPAGKNFGFVNMPNYVEALSAITSLNGTLLQGATIPLQCSFKSATDSLDSVGTYTGPTQVLYKKNILAKFISLQTSIVYLKFFTCYFVPPPPLLCGSSGFLPFPCA